MPKVLLTRHQFVNHVYYPAGEHEVSDDVAAVLKQRGALKKEPPKTTKKKNTEVNN